MELLPLTPWWRSCCSDLDHPLTDNNWRENIEDITGSAASTLTWNLNSYTILSSSNDISSIINTTITWQRSPTRRYGYGGVEWWHVQKTIIYSLLIPHALRSVLISRPRAPGLYMALLFILRFTPSSTLLPARLLIRTTVQRMEDTHTMLIYEYYARIRHQILMLYLENAAITPARLEVSAEVNVIAVAPERSGKPPLQHAVSLLRA